VRYVPFTPPTRQHGANRTLDYKRAIRQLSAFVMHFRRTAIEPGTFLASSRVTAGVLTGIYDDKLTTHYDRYEDNAMLNGWSTMSIARWNAAEYGKAYGRTTALLMATASGQLPMPIHE